MPVLISFICHLFSIYLLVFLYCIYIYIFIINVNDVRDSCVSNTTPVLYDNVMKFGTVFEQWWRFQVLDRWHRFLRFASGMVVNGGMTSLVYVEPLLFAYCKNVEKSRTSIPNLIFVC